MENTPATELLKELRGQGHRLRVEGERLLLTEQVGVKITAEQRVGIMLYRGALYHQLATEAVRAAICAAVDAIAKDWPRTGAQPSPTLEAIGAEAQVDARMKAEPFDLSKVLESIAAWRAAWVTVVRRHRRQEG